MRSSSSLKTRFAIVRPLIIITAVVVLVALAISQIGSGAYATSTPYLEDAAKTGDSAGMPGASGPKDVDNKATPKNPMIKPSSST